MATAAHLVIAGTVGAQPLRAVGSRLTFEELLHRPAWQRDAFCREYPDVDLLPAKGGDFESPKAICARCIVAGECRAFALADRTLAGVWGGTTQIARLRMIGARKMGG